MRSISVILLGLVVALQGQAAAPEGLKIGDPIPPFENLPTTKGSTVSLGDFTEDVLVIVVTCNECPVARSYEPRFVEFVRHHREGGKKVGFLAVNPYDREGDTMKEMKERAEEMEFPFPYAQDVEQKLTKGLGAKKTPHLFVFDKDRKLVYQGAFDDSWVDPGEVKKHYLEDVVAALASKSPVPPSTKPEGCAIHFD